MKRPQSSRRLVPIVCVATLAAVAYAQGPPESRRLILAADEGDPVGTHVIKADMKTGSTRLGVGLQHVGNGQGIPLHMHEKEDEILFVHEGAGVGAVGSERRQVTAGTTLYIPQGTWHGIESRSDDMRILWVVSPPNFAENLRERAANEPGAGMPSSSVAEIARKHGIRDARDYFLPRLAIIAATLGFTAVLLGLLTRARFLPVATIFTAGTTLATLITTAAIGPGDLPPAVFFLAPVLVCLAVFLGAAGGAGIRSFTRRKARED